MRRDVFPRIRNFPSPSMNSRKCWINLVHIADPQKDLQVICIRNSCMIDRREFTPNSLIMNYLNQYIYA